LGKGFREGLSAALEAYRTGLLPAVRGEAARDLFGGPMSQPIASPIPGIAGQIIGQPGRIVQGIHAFFKTLRYEQNIQALAVRDALAKGLEGNARDLHIARLTETPTDEMVSGAVADAMKELYMRAQPFDSMGAKLSRLTNDPRWPVLKIIAPFVKIGS